MSEQGVLCSDFIFSPDPLAQLAEQLPFKQWVWSSNLQRVTIGRISEPYIVWGTVYVQTKRHSLS